MAAALNDVVVLRLSRPLLICPLSSHVAYVDPR